ncbi:MAG: VanZ family protein [Bacteroidota bacterium]|nr:VanZ family protein [Bacteroidota bacterium]
MFFKKLLPAFLWAILILVLSELPGKNFSEFDFSFLAFLKLDKIIKPDKIVHMYLYCVQVFFLISGLSNQNSLKFLKKNPVIISILLSGLYGYLMEILQRDFFIGRSYDIKDVLANVTGSFIGWFVYLFYIKKISKE